ncbi:MtN3_slv domain-containing protein, partial [Cephalotus follicularis]
GNVVSFGLFLSPSPTMYKIYKKKSVEEFQAIPYIATVMNCMLWVYYGMPFVTKHNTLVYTINAIGLVIELIYLVILYMYDKQSRIRKQIMFGLLGEIILMVAIILGTLLGIHKFSARDIPVGVMCDIFNIIMYFSPLAIARKVIRTKSVKYMPLWLSVTGFVNAVLWTAYGLIIYDLFILISNGCGVVFGAMQLILYGVYYRSTPKDVDDDDAVKPSEVQLS